MGKLELLTFKIESTLRAKAELEQQLTTLKEQLITEMELHQLKNAETGSYKYVVKTLSNDKIDEDKVKDLAPELYTKCIKTVMSFDTTKFRKETPAAELQKYVVKGTPTLSLAMTEIKDKVVEVAPQETPKQTIGNVDFDF